MSETPTHHHRHRLLRHRHRRAAVAAAVEWSDLMRINKKESLMMRPPMRTLVTLRPDGQIVFDDELTMDEAKRLIVELIHRQFVDGKTHHIDILPLSVANPDQKLDVN